MILKYRTRISALLKDNDKVRTAFNKETIDLENYINKSTGNKCFYAFLSGVIISAIMFGGAFYYIKTNSNNALLTRLEKTIKGY